MTYNGWCVIKPNQMDPRTRKLTTMPETFYLREDIDCLCQKKKEEEDLPAGKNAYMHQCKNSRIKKSKERLLTTTNNNISNIRKNT